MPASLKPFHTRRSVCAGLALAMHGAVLAWLAPSVATSSVAQSSARPMQVRLALSSPDKPAWASAADAVTPSGNLSQAAQVAPEMPQDTARVDDGAEGHDAASHAAQDRPQAPEEQEGYIPRPLLHVAPRPQAPIVLPYPAEFNDRGRYTVVLNLFIEKDGQVSRVDFEGVPLPEALARAARSTFEHARFTPGQRYGRIVKSLIKIEVDFDNSAG